MENRKERRAIKNSNPDNYNEMVIKYNIDIENILEKNIDLILEGLNLTKELMENSMMNLMQTNMY